MEFFRLKSVVISVIKKYSKMWELWMNLDYAHLYIPVLVHNFLGHLHFFKKNEIMSLKYGNLMLPAWHILDLYWVRISNTASFCENYAKLYFDAKHLKKGWNRGG